MLKTLIKAVAYHKAPRATFTVLHPKSAARLKKAQFDMRHALAPRIAAVGAAAIALPLGYLLARGGSRAGTMAQNIRRRMDDNTDSLDRAQRPMARDRTMVNTPRPRTPGPDALRV